jgi:hypothetical protein
MASPLYYLSKKLKQLPGFKTPGDRAFSIIGLILVTIVVLYAIGAYRDHVAISTCKAQGGTPIFRTVIGETIIDANGNSAKLADYQEFDRCEVKP